MYVERLIYAIASRRAAKVRERKRESESGREGEGRTDKKLNSLQISTTFSRACMRVLMCVRMYVCVSAWAHVCLRV